MAERARFRHVARRVRLWFTHGRRQLFRHGQCIYKIGYEVVLFLVGFVFLVDVRSQHIDFLLVVLHICQAERIVQKVHEAIYPYKVADLSC